jgi:hypothetical protein
MLLLWCLRLVHAVSLQCREVNMMSNGLQCSCNSRLARSTHACGAPQGMSSPCLDKQAGMFAHDSSGPCNCSSKSDSSPFQVKNEVGEWVTT